MVALILQGIFTLASVFLLSILGGISAGFGGFGVTIAAIFLVVIIVGLAFLYAGYKFAYKKIQSGDYAGASTWALILGIIGIFTFLIPGIIWIVTWVKTKDAVNEQASMGGRAYGTPSFGLPSAPAMAGSVPGAPSPPSVPVPFSASTCPRCQRTATWVPQYGRYYCFPCAQYV